MEQMEQMEQMFRKFPKTRALRDFPKLPFHLFHLFHHHSRPNQPSTEKEVKLTSFLGHSATARQLGDLRQAKKWTNCPLLQREPKRPPPLW